MQSTGHPSMLDLSSTSTQGCAMMYVTFRTPLSRAVPVGGLGLPVFRVVVSIPARRASAHPGRRDSPAGRRLSAQYQDALRRCARVADPALVAGGGAPLVAAEADLVDVVCAGVGHQPGGHLP